MGTGSTSQTLVVHQVRIGSSGTLKLRAAGGKLVRAALTGVPGAPDSVAVTACLGTQTSAETGVAAAGGAGVALYAVPFRSRDVGFAYLATWSRPDRRVRDHRIFGDGVPASPVYRQRAARPRPPHPGRPQWAAPATDDAVVRSRPVPPWADCARPAVLGGDLTPPFTATTFVTAGAWTSRVDTGYTDRRGQSFDTGISYLTRTLDQPERPTPRPTAPPWPGPRRCSRPSTATSSGSPPRT